MEQNVDLTAGGAGVVPEEPAKLESQLASGANWFFWIAGLSLINSIVLLSGGQWSFVVGLGITQVADAIGAAVVQEVGGGVGLRTAVFAFDAFVAGVFVLFGVLARKRHTWAIATGMVLYAADGLLFLLVADWLSLGFHAFALFGLFGGLTASRKLAALDRPVDPAFSSQPIVP